MGGDHRRRLNQQYHGAAVEPVEFDPSNVDFDAELVLASMLPRTEQEPSQTLGGTTREQRAAEVRTTAAGMASGDGE